MAGLFCFLLRWWCCWVLGVGSETCFDVGVAGVCLLFIVVHVLGARLGVVLGDVL